MNTHYYLVRINTFLWVDPASIKNRRWTRYELWVCQVLREMDAVLAIHIKACSDSVETRITGRIDILLGEKFHEMQTRDLYKSFIVRNVAE